MAKQTFTTGQVLTAAQMTDLQQTALGGGSATAKVASYVLVAADAGTVVIMNSGSPTTITVNTGLFAAGDTVVIQNIGAGATTITAGTATVNASASLALAQYEAGTLYFTSASASIFRGSNPGDITAVTAGTGISGGGSSGAVTVTNSMATAIDAKGDLVVGTGADAFSRLAVGANDTILVADSAQATGIKWATASSGGMTLLNPGGTTLTSSSTAITGISGSYVSLVVFISGVNVSSNCNFTCRINSTTTTIAQGGTDNATAYSDTSSTHINLRGTQDEMKSGNADSVFFLQVDNYASTTFNKTFTLISRFLHPAGTVRTLNAGGSILLPSTAISSLEFVVSAGTFSAGTALVYGVK